MWHSRRRHLENAARHESDRQESQNQQFLIAAAERTEQTVEDEGAHDPCDGETGSAAGHFDPADQFPRGRAGNSHSSELIIAGSPAMESLIFKTPAEETAAELELKFLLKLRAVPPLDLPEHDFTVVDANYELYYYSSD